MSARTQFDNVVQDTSGNALADIEVTVYQADGTTPATIYAARTGGTTVSNPITTDSTGLVQFWAEPEEYYVEYHDTELPERVADRTRQFNAVNGGDEGIGITQLPNGTAGQLLLASGAGGGPGFGQASTSGIRDNAVDKEKLSIEVGRTLGVNVSGSVRRGAVFIDTEEFRNSASYGTLTTPDQVSNVVLPSGGLILVAYTARFKSSVADAGRAAIFVGATQLQSGAQSGGYSANEASTENTGYRLLSTDGTGLVGGTLDSASNDAPLPTTGGSVGIRGTVSFGGGPVLISAAAGTYTISVQFKATSGTVTASGRKLWVWTLGF